MNKTKNELVHVIIGGWAQMIEPEWWAMWHLLHTASKDALRRIAGGAMYRATANARGLEL
jgi:hypothetical protein